MWFWTISSIPLYHLWICPRLQMCYTTTNCVVIPTWASLHSILYSRRWLWWVLLRHTWRRTRSQAMVLLLWRMQLSCSFQMFSWGRPKCQVTNIMATYLEMLHNNLTIKTTLNDTMVYQSAHCNSAFMIIVYRKTNVVLIFICLFSIWV